MEEYGIVFEPADRSLMENPNTVASSTWKTAKNPSTIRRQLDSIVIPVLAYDSLTLAEVSYDMMYSTTWGGVGGDGLSFLFAAPRGATNQPQPARIPVPVIPTLGDPPPGVAIPYGMDLSSVLINFQLPMFKLELREVMDAVVRTADQPIKYTVLDYAVEFAPESLKTSAAIAQPSSMKGPEAQGTQALLREITIPMIAFDALYLEGVVRDLNNQLRRRNKDTKVRFRIRKDIIAKKPLRYWFAFFQSTACDLNLEQTLDAILQTSVYEIAYSIDGHRVDFHLPNVKEK
ncbi:MAG: hypothetical protein ACJASX_002879 [Limisphaerales bacterium]|jgi:hypothetical protein